MNRRRITFQIFFIAATGLSPFKVTLADGMVVDKIYHPYVDALESELEFRAIKQDRQPNLITAEKIHQVSMGKAFGQNGFGEIYLIGARDRSGRFAMEAWEAEWKWQLTQQGQYAVDWGLLFEYENEHNDDIEEISIGILAEKELGRWSTTANLFFISEWGEDIQDEFETSLGLQMRYRYSRLFEPGMELYAGQNSRGVGPIIQGTFETGIRKNLHWETGVIFGIGDESPNTTIRLLLEFEF